MMHLVSNSSYVSVLLVFLMLLVMLLLFSSSPSVIIRIITRLACVARFLLSLFFFDFVFSSLSIIFARLDSFLSDPEDDGERTSAFPEQRVTFWMVSLSVTNYPRSHLSTTSPGQLACHCDGLDSSFLVI